MNNFLGSNILFLRERSGETQKQLAEVLKCDFRTIHKYEKGENRCPNLDLILRLSKHYNIGNRYFVLAEKINDWLDRKATDAEEKNSQ